MKLMVLNNSAKSSGKAAGGAGGAEAPAAAKAETTTGAEVRKRFEFVLLMLYIILSKAAKLGC